MLIECEPEQRLKKFIDTENITGAKSMESFISTMLEIMKKLYDQSLEHKRSNEYFRSTQPNKYEDKDTPAKPYKKPFFAARKQTVNHVEHELEEAEYDSEDLSSLAELTHAPSTVLDTDGFPEPPVETSEATLEPDDATQFGELNEIKGMAAMPKTDPATLACFKAMTEGVCRKKECTYSHDRNDIAKQAAELAAKLAGKPWTKVEKNREPPLFNPGKPSYPRK